jgi:chemotaxis protein CheC
MILTAEQQDGLTELINIAFSRTAASLSELTGQRVLLDVPDVAIYPGNTLVHTLAEMIRNDVATVHQVFHGSMEGDALLLLDYDSAVMLTVLLTNEPLINRLDSSAREVLTEVGNILLNACLSMFGDLLHTHLAFSVPRLKVEGLQVMLNELIAGKEELRYALVVYTDFRLRDSAVNGYLVLVLGVGSLDRLIQGLEEA